MPTGAILPALNAARFLPAVIADIKAHHPDLRVLVVDDGSTDGTGEAARGAGAEVAAHPVNRGKGAALKTGYRWALDEGIDWVFTMDADGQHLPAEMQRFLDAAATGRWDVLVGDRMAEVEGMPWIRLVTNRFTSWVTSRLAGRRIPDSQNGFRLYRTAVLDGVPLTARRYDAETEVLVRLGRRGARIGSVPVSTVYGDEKSSINPLVDTGRFFRLVLRLLTTRDTGPRRSEEA